MKDLPAKTQPPLGAPPSLSAGWYTSVIVSDTAPAGISIKVLAVVMEALAFGTTTTAVPGGTHVDVGVTLGVGVRVFVAVGVLVELLVGVGVFVAVLVGDAVLVGVSVGIGVDV